MKLHNLENIPFVSYFLKRPNTERSANDLFCSFYVSSLCSRPHLVSVRQRWVSRVFLTPVGSSR